MSCITSVTFVNELKSLSGIVNLERQITWHVRQCFKVVSGSIINIDHQQHRENTLKPHSNIMSIDCLHSTCTLAIVVRKRLDEKLTVTSCCDWIYRSLLAVQ